MQIVLNYLGRPSQEVVGYLAVCGSECCPSEAIVATEAIVAAHAERNTFPMCGRNAVWGEVCDCHSLYYLSHTVAIDQKTDGERGFGLIRTYFFHWRLSFNMQGKIGEFKPRRWHIVMKITKKKTNKTPSVIPMLVMAKRGQFFPNKIFPFQYFSILLMTTISI